MSCVCACLVVSDSVTPWSVARQTPLSMRFSARILELVAISPPGDLPVTGTEAMSPGMQVDSLPLSHKRSPIDMRHYIK